MSNELFQQIGKVLDQIDRPGSFCASGSVPVVLPGLQVKALGMIGLPLTPSLAEKLKERCEQAAYGKGEQTLVDTDVRRVWHMKPEHFKLTNPEWQTLLQQMVVKVQEELGLEKQALEAHLYDLLLYEKGSFFLPHRDGEKLERMVATLVVVLPSSFEGGELIVRHEGQEQTIDFGGEANPFSIHYAAFYADCEHEVRPLRKGYRLCLVYNLTLKKGKKGLSAPRSSEFVEPVAQLLEQWAKTDSARRLVVTLDHQYTQDGLTWDALKGVDRVKAHVLHEAAEKAGCQIALALLTFHECREAYEEFGYGGRRHHWDDEDGEDEEDESSNYEEGGLLDSSLSAEHWSDPEGKLQKIGEITINRNELLNPEALEDVDPEEQFEGYTGNAGNTVDRWYRHAALFLWPYRKRFDILCDAGCEDAIAVLKSMVKKWQNSSKKNADTVRTDCIDLASSIITRWRHVGPGSFRDKKAASLMPLLEAINDPGLMKAYLREVVVKDASVSPGKPLVNVCQQYGWATFQPELQLVFQGTTVETIERNVEMLESICLAKPGKMAEGWIELCRSLAETTVAALKAIDKPTMDWRSNQLKRVNLLAGLVRSLLATEHLELLSRLVNQVRALPTRYPLTPTVVSTLTELGPWLTKNVKKSNPVLSDWIAECRKQLEVLTARASQSPADFRRSAPITCTCRDCQELKEFLANPREEMHHFRYGENRRRHLEERIRAHKCDLDCTTNRRGSPHTLVCTKNANSYKAGMKTFQQNQEHLAALKSLQASLPK